MAYALLFNGSGYVSIPAKTAGSASTDTWTALFDLEIPNTSNQTIYAATSTAFTDIFRITGANTVAWRIGAGTTNNITISQNWPIGTRFLLGIYRESGRNLVITIDGVEVYRANSVSFGGGGNAISVTSIGKASVGTFSGKMYEATIQGENYLNPDQPDTTVWGDGTLTGIPSTNWEPYGGVATPISFSGTIPTQSFTNGESVSVDLSTYFSGTETPFTFTNTGTALTGSGLTLSSAGLLSGTYTGTPITGVVVTGTDAATNTAASNAFNIETASAVRNISIADNLPALSSALSMTYVAAGVGTITISDWANNTGTALPNLTGITVNVRSLIDGSTVYRTTTASTDVGSDCVVSDAAIVTGTQYEVTALKFNGADYDIGIAIITAT
ncbi:hypothetical protein Barba19A_gp138 [Rheinheimera phage vB_RspM_Barba19A]|jgi:hypothetical protein|uniref:Uncharacterized protein n=3 Tax=Barbavirus TaxID=2733095 RepID=A0A4P8N7M4_9CAUD|nr:hypothetical protein HOV45_gp136 [Rheinheimera phage Barba8S]YP_009823151.1 hypothetical protein HOV47_gp138 [Rheinheimera phage vB_RspM_Barba19A]QCQ59767.1 hypothetical protein Barba8S_gp136 [Rheinheimera phage Barba8S]QCQ61978.1 hypothetical protein Barba19A_gp138 [Rheinheimera phage vB_RspM_Barba19A]QCQ64728.1 hypothetical protein Barba31A_gp138 [Rheinheimera phage vB_RspM_Barba31A]